MRPTGFEPWTPVPVKATSATERAVFRRCRRQWFLSVVHHLESPQGNPNFWLGELVHSGLEAYYKAQREGLPHVERAEAGMAIYEIQLGIALRDVRARLGFLYEFAAEAYMDLGVMGAGMLDGYFEREERYPLFDTVLDVERRLFVPIRSPGKRMVGQLAVRTDAVGIRQGRLTAVDHKTATQHLSGGSLDIDDQLTAEVYAVWKDSGQFPREAMYNALLKKLAGPPKAACRAASRAPADRPLVADASHASSSQRAPTSVSARPWIRPSARNTVRRTCLLYTSDAADE